MNINITTTELKKMMNEYDFNPSDPDYDDDLLTVFESFSAISEADRIILCLYAENQSLRKTAKTLGVSYATTRKAVAKIREEIKTEIQDRKNKKNKNNNYAD